MTDVTKIGECSSKGQVALSATAFDALSSGQVHAKTVWRVSKQSDNSTVFEVETSSNLTSITITDLDEMVPYFAQVRYVGDGGTRSEWSVPVGFILHGDWHFPEGLTESVPPSASTYPVFPAPSQPLKESEVFVTVISDNRGREQRLAKSVRIRSFSLSYQVLTKSDLDILVTFFKQQKGPLFAFNFTHPLTSEVIRCRFDDAILQPVQIESDLFSININLQEVL